MPADTLRFEVDRRRTFAIISHPDAGKTTLTEKFLLYAGCIDVAGTVRGRKTQRAVSSDWMALERERGISITSTVLSFPYGEHLINLLDTPGHEDFSEDTYRTLAAADSAVMVIDAAKGIETQTKKLFKVCAYRKIPIITFVNKLDRPARSPIDLLDEITDVLGIESVPRNWPIGDGPSFRGVYDRDHGKALLFEPTDRGSLQVPTREIDLTTLASHVDPAVASRCQEELALLEGVLPEFDRDQYLRGQMTPVFFGSAMNNYGIEQFLKAFVHLAPAPGPRPSDQGDISPYSENFAGIIFKIQANLNPKHRDRIAYVRVCSGCFSEDLEPTVTRTGKPVRIKGSHKLFASEREEIHAAYPGDVIGLSFTTGLRLGDTLCEGNPIRFEGLPQFSPERFALVRCADTRRRKQMSEGLQQLADEGAIQLFVNPDNIREPILAAVGELQFDVVRFRMESEYNAEVELELLPYKAAAWVRGPADKVQQLKVPTRMRRVLDHKDRLAVLAEDAWYVQYARNNNPGVEFLQFSDDLFVPS